MSSQSNEDTVADDVLKQLSQTSYACSSLTRLSGGTVNFVYRGILQASVKTGDETVTSVIIKHSKPHLAGKEGYLLDVSRAECEADTLKHFELSSLVSRTSVRTPRCYYFDKNMHTAVLEDIGSDAIDIKTVLTTPSLNDRLTQPTATIIGYQLGQWLHQFHTGKLTTTRKECDLPPILDHSSNAEIRKLKYDINYGAFIDILTKFPEVDTEVEKNTMNKVRDMATQETSGPVDGIKGKNYGQVHGDFWMGNVLLNDTPTLGTDPRAPSNPQLQMTVIDCEFTHINHFSYDIGQMLGDLLERHLLNDVPSASWILRGFVQGYRHGGKIDEELAFRSAIHAGVHLLGWHNRRAPWQELRGTEEQKTALVKTAVGLIKRGSERDVDWFQGSVLADLFE